MAKLKFDRLINLDVKSGENLTVPKGELWKGRVYGISSVTSFSVNNSKLVESDPVFQCVGGAIIRVTPFNSDSSATATIQGISFKVVENV